MQIVVHSCMQSVQASVPLIPVHWYCAFPLLCFYWSKHLPHTAMHTFVHLMQSSIASHEYHLMNIIVWWMNDKGEPWHYTSITLYTKACLGLTVQLCVLKRRHFAAYLMHAHTCTTPCRLQSPCTSPHPTQPSPSSPPLLLYTVLPPYWSSMQPCIPLLHSYYITQKDKLTASVPGLASIGHSAAHPVISVIVAANHIHQCFTTANWVLRAWPIHRTQQCPACVSETVSLSVSGTKSL